MVWEKILSKKMVLQQHADAMPTSTIGRYLAF